MTVRAPHARSIPTPTTDTAARALAALVMRSGGIVTVFTHELLNAPSHLDLTTGDGTLTFTGVPDHDRATAAHIRFNRDTKIALYQWTFERIGDEYTLTGNLAPTGTWPTVGNEVHIERMDMPGRGALEDLYVSVSLTNRGRRIILSITVPADLIDAP